jgi:hypothetical protein
VKVPAGLQEAMEAAAISAAQELLAAYRVTIQPAAASPAPGAAGPALAALGLVTFKASGMHGTATLGASAAILKRSNASGTPHSDWIAELANQFFGRFKLKLLRAGVELWSMAPVAVRGRLLATGVSQPQSVPFSFVDAAGGTIALWVEVEINGEVRINGQANGAEIPREGDVILF